MSAEILVGDRDREGEAAVPGRPDDVEGRPILSIEFPPPIIPAGAVPGRIDSFISSLCDSKVLRNLGMLLTAPTSPLLTLSFINSIFCSSIQVGSSIIIRSSGPIPPPGRRTDGALPKEGIAVDANDFSIFIPYMNCSESFVKTVYFLRRVESSTFERRRPRVGAVLGVLVVLICGGVAGEGEDGSSEEVIGDVEWGLLGTV